jgi:hypothetical protein
LGRGGGEVEIKRLRTLQVIEVTHEDRGIAVSRHKRG